MITAVRIIAFFGILLSAPVLADESSHDRLQGDVGGFLSAAQSPIRGEPSHLLLLPYAYFDYGRVFARVDTFGFKTVRLAQGYLEVVGRVKFDGYLTSGNPAMSGIGDRQDSAPIGLGTFQLTHLGGLFLYGFHDMNLSKGNLYEATWVTRFRMGRFTLYPQLTMERYTKNYTRYYYGVSADESVRSGYPAYAPKASTIVALRLLLEYPLGGGWISQLYVQRKRLGSAISDSPLVASKFVNNGYVTLAFRFR